MLQLRPNCECCDKDLPPDTPDARICSYECTFCAACVENVLLRNYSYHVAAANYREVVLQRVDRLLQRVFQSVSG